MLSAFKLKEAERINTSERINPDGRVGLEAQSEALGWGEAFFLVDGQVVVACVASKSLGFQLRRLNRPFVGSQQLLVWWLRVLGGQSGGSSVETTMGQHLCEHNQENDSQRLQ